MKLLEIDSSPMGEAAISRHLTKEFVQRWISANPQGTVIKRDLTTIAIPVIDAAWVSANYAPKESRTPASSSERPLTGKRATFIIAAGSSYDTSSTNASKNYLVPWIRTLFGSLGVDDIQFVLADGTRETNNGKIERATFLAPHVEAIHALFAQERIPIEADAQP